MDVGPESAPAQLPLAASLPGVLLLELQVGRQVDGLLLTSQVPVLWHPLTALASGSACGHGASARSPADAAAYLPHDRANTALPPLVPAQEEAPATSPATAGAGEEDEGTSPSTALQRMNSLHGYMGMLSVKRTRTRSVDVTSGRGLEPQQRMQGGWGSLDVRWSSWRVLKPSQLRCLATSIQVRCLARGGS